MVAILILTYHYVLVYLYTVTIFQQTIYPVVNMTITVFTVYKRLYTRLDEL